MRFTIIFLLAQCALAYPPLRYSRRGTYSGVATFNNYASQSNTVCGPMSAGGGMYGAAASDISPDIAGDRCSGTIDMSLCNGQNPQSGYQGPSCPTGNCGKCYKVTNTGGADGASVGGQGNSVVVQIIDSCPSESAYNYCKTDVPADQRCGSSSTNQLDIDQSAYQVLTGQSFGSGPNLAIQIEDADCSTGKPTSSSASKPGGSGSGGGSNAAASPASSPALAVAQQQPSSAPPSAAAVPVVVQPVNPNPQTQQKVDNNDNNQPPQATPATAAAGGSADTAPANPITSSIPSPDTVPFNAPPVKNLASADADDECDVSEL